MKKRTFERIFCAINSFLKSKYKNPLLVFLCLFNAAILFFNILFYKSGIAIILLIIDYIFLIFFSLEDVFKLFLFLLPFTFVFKDPHISTSFVSLFLFGFYIKVIVMYIKKPNILSTPFMSGCFLLLFLSIYGVIVSFLNFSISYMRMLPSYFLYLALPLFLNLIKNDNGTILLKSYGYATWMLFGALISSLVALPFFYLFSNGEKLLEHFTGVPFAKGNDEGTIYRFSALNPDPNYSTVLLVLPIFILLLSDIPKKEKTFGYVLAAVASVINLLSLSKMYYLCFVILLVIILAEIYVSLKSKILVIVLILAIFICAFFLLTTPSGMALFNRFFSSESSSIIKHFTSNRSDLFSDYCRYVLYNPEKLFFGVGPTAIDRVLFTNETHNAFVGTLYQNGLFGTILILFYYYVVGSPALKKEQLDPISFSGFIICLVLVFNALNMETSVFTPVVFSLFAFSKKKGASVNENNCSISI